MRFYWKVAVLALLAAPVFAGCGANKPEEPVAAQPSPELEQQVLQQIQARQNQNVAPPVEGQQ